MSERREESLGERLRRCDHVVRVSIRNMIGGPVERINGVEWCAECGSMRFRDEWSTPLAWRSDR